MDPEIDFVTLLGTAGTGKTSLALAAGLAQTMDQQRYREIIMTRATVSVGEDIGFLPGTEEEKMTPWMGALTDNLEVLTHNQEGGTWGRQATNDLLASRIKIRSMNFMRGRTFPSRYLILDEAQNLTPKQMKTLITRAGPGTKIVCLGNVEQIDTPYLTETTSGLTYAVDRFKNWPHSAHITLRRGERSRLADYASRCCEPLHPPAAAHGGDRPRRRPGCLHHRAARPACRLPRALASPGWSPARSSPRRCSIPARGSLPRAGRVSGYWAPSRQQVDQLEAKLFAGGPGAEGAGLRPPVRRHRKRWQAVDLHQRLPSARRQRHQPRRGKRSASATAARSSGARCSTRPATPSASCSSVASAGPEGPADGNTPAHLSGSARSRLVRGRHGQRSARLRAPGGQPYDRQHQPASAWRWRRATGAVGHLWGC